MDLDQKAKELNEIISRNPSLYISLAKVVNTLAKISAVFNYVYSKFKADPTSQIHFKSKPKSLKKKYKTYLSLLPSVQDSNGFIDINHCDSLLFSGLLGTITKVNIEAARDSNGMWHRRPLNYISCYPNHSKSTISRDMFIGLLWDIWKNQKLELAENLFNNGKENDWIMGEGLISRIYFTPGLQSTLAEVIYQLGGTNHIERHIPVLIGKGNDGFAAHLDILHVLLRAELKGGKTEHLDVINQHYKRNPNNALFTYAHHKYTDGVQDETIDILLSDKLFPSDRLPTDCDRREGWIWQRDMGDDWEPKRDCNGYTHSGGDFLLVAKLVLEDNLK